MSQHNQRKHYHIHAPYQHHPPVPPPPHSHAHALPPPPSHHAAQQQQHSHHQQQQQQQQHQQWYNAHANIPPQQQQYHHGLHIRDSRHLQQHAPPPPPPNHHPQQHPHQPPPPPHGHVIPPPHMFTSGYAAAGMSGGSGAVVASSTHSQPASAGSSSASVAQHYSTLAGGSNNASTGNSVVGGGGVIVGRNRVYDLEMINTQHSGGGGGGSSASAHSLLSASGGGRVGYDAFSHSSLYSTQPSPSQRHHQQQHHHHYQQQQQQQQHYYHHHRLQQQQHQQQHQHMTPMITNIKSEPVEQLTITPSIQMEEIIIKPEPLDEIPFHKNAPQIENNTFTMNEERKHQLHQQQQQLQQQQQQQQQQQRQQQRVQQASVIQEQKHHHHQQRPPQPHIPPSSPHHHHQQQQHQLHLQQQQQHLHHPQQQQSQPQPPIQHHPHQQHPHSQHHRPPPHQNENVSQHQHQQQLQQRQPPTQQLHQQQPIAIVKTEISDIPPATAAAEEKSSPPTSLANIKSEPKPLNFPRRKLQTERSSTLPICQRCKQVFLKRQNYAQHVALSCCNIVEYDFKCSICPMSFMSNEELQSHEQLHRLNRYFCQKYCGKYYETIEECEQHEFGQHEYDMFKCNICCVSFPKRDQLFTHLVDHRQQPRYDCCICRLCFQDLLELEDHYVGNPDFCGKYYDKEDFKNLKCFAKTNKQTQQPQSLPAPNRTENLTSFLIKDITSIKIPETTERLPSSKQHQQRQKQQLSTPHKTTPQPPPAASDNYDDIPDFAAPHVEVKTEIKVEPDFYPPMDQSDFGAFDNDYSNSQDFAPNAQQSLTFMQDYQDNASSSTNSSFSFNNTTPTASTTTTSSKNTEAIQDEDAMCCVPKCGVRKFTSPTLQFFPFPRDEKYLLQWLHNLKMTFDPNVNYGIYRVCSLHFPKRCVARYSLSYWAVPTFNLGHDDVGNLYQNRESSGGFPSGEMARCYMPGCLSQRGETNVKFHSFPRDLKTLIKWCQNSRLPIHSKENRFFCSRHFDEKCFGKFRLKPWAIPTLRLGTVYGKIHDNPNIYQEEKKCFLPFCRRSRSYDCNLSLYRFPRDETLLRRWCYNLRLDPEMYRGKNHKICSSHFVKEALGLRKLNPGAVPTMNLGHNDTFNIYENELYTPPPPPPPPQPSTSSKAKKFADMFKQDMGGSSTSTIYDEVFMNSMIQKFGASATNTSNLDLGDVCLVPTCKRTRHSDNVTLHTVPKRAEQLKKWCHNLKMDLEKLHKSVRICSAHFESYCIGGCMRPFAVPTLELGHDDSDIFRNPDVIKKLNIRETCCVPVCKRNRDRDHANLHRFPTHPELLQKWCENLHKPVPDGTKLFNDAVCEVHFEERCLRNKRLEKWSIPTINLGYDDITHHLPSEEEIAEHWTKPFAPNNGDEQGECCVSSCRRNPQIDDVKLYRPPEDAEQLLKWAHNLQLDAATLPLLKICNLHFESHCIGKRLLNWAMPTLNLASKVEHLFENPPPMPSAYKKKEKHGRLSSKHEMIKWSPRCCLSHCRKTRAHDNIQLFRFPYANRQTLAKWCHNIQLPLVGSSHRRICSAHFDPAVLTKRCPMNLAVPTLNLNTHPGYKLYQNPARLKHIRVGVPLRQCIVESCRKTKADGVVLFRFPNNRTILQKWRHNIKNWPKGKLNTLMRVCSDHFESHSVGGRRISPGAIPTLKLGHDSEDLYPNEVRSYFDLEKCVVKGCTSRKDDDIRLFRFPRDDEELLAKWCHNLNRDPADCVGVRICIKHFEVGCQGPKLLYKWAIPTLHLGHKEEDKIEIIENPPPDQRSGEYIFKCCVPNCGKTRKYDDAQMNSFPKHLKLFRKWKHNLKLDFLNFKEREKYKICNDHFEAVCVGKTRLNFGAIPTLNLGHNENEDLYKINPDRIRPNLFIKQRDIERMERKQMRLEEIKLNVDMDEQQQQDMDGTEQDDDALDPLSTPAECCVEECSAPKSIMREPYDLPETVELRELWCKSIKKDVKELANDSKLCGLHFQEIFLKLKDEMEALKTNASAEVKLDCGKLLFAYQKSEISLVVNGFQCRVEGCSSNLLCSDLRLYYFPYGKDIGKKWSHNTGIIPDENRRYMNKVCSLHFEPFCITETQRLRSWAIPTLNLKHENPESIYKNPDLTRIDRRMIGPQIQRCAVKNCESAQDSEGVKLFNFPTDEVFLRKWCANLKMSRHLTPLYKICTLHFEKMCFGSARIRSWAIPTKNLGHNENPEYFNKTTIKKEVYEQKPSIDNEQLQLKQVKIKKSLDTVKCYISSCRRSRLQHGVRFYPLPSHSKMKRKWLHNLQIPSNKAAKVQNLRICNLHFHKRCLEGKNLKSWAVPTMHLGHTEHIFDNPRRLQNVFAAQRCILTHCKNHTLGNETVRTFVFPKSPEFLEKWSKNLKLDITKCKGRLCHEHFEEGVKGEKKLKNGAVPTLALGGHEEEEELPYDNIDLIKKLEIKSSEMGNKNEELPEDEEEMEEEDDDDEYADYEDEDEDLGADGYLVEDAAADYSDDEEEDEDEDEDEEEDENGQHDGDNENEDEVEEEEEEEEVDMTKIRLRGTSQHWSSIKMKELRVRLVPIRQEDLLEMSSISSYERDRRSITPASSLRELRSETPASVGGGHTSSEYNDENSSSTTTPLRTDRPINNIAPRCCLKHCGKEKTPDQHLTTYGFPKDPQLLQKWCDNLGLQPEECIGRVCIDHFELRVIGTRRLKLGAVPTLNLGNSRSAKHTNDETKPKTAAVSTDLETKAAAVAAGDNEQILTPPPPYCNPKTGKQSVFRLCCLKHCRRKKQSVKETQVTESTAPPPPLLLFKFPQDYETLKKWSANLRLPEKICGRKELRVCSKHFEPALIDKEGCLKANALPTLDLSYSQRPPVFKNQTKSSEQKMLSIKKEESSIIDDKLQTKTEEVSKVTPQPQPPPPEMVRKPRKSLKKVKIPPPSNGIPPQGGKKQQIAGIVASKPPKSLKKGKVPQSDNKPQCFLPHCGKKEDLAAGTFLIGFTQNDPNTQRKWCTNLKLGRKTPKHNEMKICNHHFESYAFYKQKCLKVGAVPTLNLGHNERIFRNAPRIRRKVRTEPKERCCIKTCDNKEQTNSTKLYPFPKNSELRRIWCNNLQIELREALSCHYKLCGNHFSTDSFEAGSQILKINAVPSLNLGLENYDNQKVLSKIETVDDRFKCLVESCQKSSSVDKVKLYELPKSKELRKKWLYNLNLSPDIDIETTRICNRHFEKGCIKHGQLHAKAVPTMFLKAKSWFYENDEDVFEEEALKCCVSNCNYQTNEDEEFRVMYKFPKQKEDLDKWIYNLKLPQLKEDDQSQEIKDMRVCSRHFEDACKIKDHQLMMGTVPTLHLGHEQMEDIHFNLIQKCCIDNCPWLGLQCHQLPADDNVKQIWLGFLKQEEESSSNNLEYMCSVHFLAWFERIEETAENQRLKELYESLKDLPEMKTFKCSVPNCETGFKLFNKLFKFPKDLTLLQKWLHNSSLKFEPKERAQYRICVRHFEERCLTEKELHRWSLPTLDLPYNLSLYVNPPEALPSNHENLKHCCVSACNTEKGPFFQFPSKSIEVKKWIHNLDLGPQQCTLNLRVCFKHFETYCLSTDEGGEIKKLKNWAVPTLNLARTKDLNDNPPEKVDFFVCCVCRELQNKAEGLYLFRFPTRLASFLKWLHNLKMPRSQYRDSMRICLKHFETECFDKSLKLIRKHSMPTIGVKCPKKDLFTNPTRKSLSKCCVSSCEGPWLHLNPFPKEKMILKKWCFNLKIKEPDLEAIKNWKICQRHFETKCLNAFGLIRPTAVPTLDLGHRNKIFKNSRKLTQKGANDRVVERQVKSVKIVKAAKLILKEEIKKETTKEIKAEDKSLKTAKTEEKKQESLEKPIKASKPLIKKRKMQIEGQKLCPKKNKEINATKVSKEGKQPPTTLTTQNCAEEDLDKYQSLGAYIREKKKQNKPESAATTILQNTKKRKISKKFLPVKPEPENRPLLHIITEDASQLETSSIEEITQSMNNLLDLQIKQEFSNTKGNLIQVQEADQQCFEVKIEPLDDGTQKQVTEEEEQQQQNERPASASQRLLGLTQKCSISTCTNATNTPGCLFFRYPPNPRLRSIWVRHCQETCTFAQTLTKKRKICAEHFESQCLIENRLLLGAIPTLQLGDDELEDLEDCGEVLNEFRYMRCRVEECQRSVDLDQVHKIPFPQEGEVKTKWCFNLNLNENDITENDWICHRHFERRALAYKSRNIKEEAVPTLMLGSRARPEEELYKNPEYVNQQQVFIQLRQVCCVGSCSNTRQMKGIRFSSFPKRKDIYEKWLHNLDLDDSIEVRNAYHICWQHFEEICYTKYSFLKIGSIPTLKLDKQEDLIAIDPTQLVEVDSFGKRVKHHAVLKKYECKHPECTEAKIQVFKAPEMENIRKLWLESVGLQLPHCMEQEEEINFCDEHFYKLYKQFARNLEEISEDVHKKELDSLNKTFRELAAKSKFFSRQCSVPQCPTDQYFSEYREIKLYNFPQNSEITKKWCYNCSIDFEQLDKTKINYYKICEKHFEGFCFNKRSIFSWAVPTLNLPDSRPKDLLENDPEDKWAYTGECCISSCVNAHGFKWESKSRLYKFPENPAMLAKWLQNVKCDNFQANETKICGLHFRAKCIRKRRLIEEAIPTLKLGQPEETELITDEIRNTTPQAIVIKEEPRDEEEEVEEEQEQLEVIDKKLKVEQEEREEDVVAEENSQEMLVAQRSADGEGQGGEEDDSWNDHDYCFELKPEKSSLNQKFEPISIKQELIEDQYGLEDQMQFEIPPAIKQEIIEIDEMPHHSYNEQNINEGSYEYFEDDEVVGQHITLTCSENATEHSPSNNLGLVISEVKSQIRFCCVQKCCNSSETLGVKLYSEFPKDSEIFIKWCFNVKIDPRNYKENQYAICSQHFDAICFSDNDLHSLHAWAVPTLNLNLPENAFIHRNDPPLEQCIVYGCIQPMPPLYKFPLRLDLCEKWFANLKLDLTDYRAQNYRICRRHFVAECFDANHLLKTEAIPTQCLGHADSIAHLNAFEIRAQEQEPHGGGGGGRIGPVGGDLMHGIVGAGLDNSRGSSQGSLVRHHLISPHDLEDHDSSYFEDFEECYGQDE